jgi:adenine deaminase
MIAGSEWTSDAGTSALVGSGPPARREVTETPDAPGTTEATVTPARMTFASDVLGLDGLLPTAAELVRLRRIARGEEDADFVVRGGTVVVVHSGELIVRDVVIGGRHIAAVTQPGALSGRRSLDATGRYVLPAFVDADFTFERALLQPGELARLVLPRGTVTVVADTSEMVELCGPAGRALLTGSGTPLRVLSTRAPDRFAAGLELPRQPGVAGPGRPAGPSPVVGDTAVVGDMAVVGGTAVVGDTTEAAGIRVVDGSGGMAPAGDPSAIAPLVSLSATVHDLAAHGHLDVVVRRAVAGGTPPAVAIRGASLAPAQARGIAAAVGSITPTRLADLQIVTDLTLSGPPDFVVAGGRIAARAGQPLFDNLDICPEWARETTALPGGLHGGSFRATANAAARTVSIEPASVQRADSSLGPGRPSGLLVRPARLDAARFDAARLDGTRLDADRSGRWEPAADPRAGLLKTAVLRRGTEAAPRVGFLRGLGLTRGAIGFTTGAAAGDLVVIGVDDYDLLTAARALEGMGGGFVVVDRGWVRAACPLPVAGTLSDAPWEALLGELRGVDEAVGELGCRISAPFQALRALGADLLVPLG